MTSCRLQSNYSSTVTLHGGPVVLRPARATPGLFSKISARYCQLINITLVRIIQNNVVDKLCQPSDVIHQLNEEMLAVSQLKRVLHFVEVCHTIDDGSISFSRSVSYQPETISLPCKLFRPMLC